MTPPSRHHAARLATEASNRTHQLADFVARLGAQLLVHGATAERVEAVILATARHEGHDADVFSVPTGLWMSLAPRSGGVPITRLIRVATWTVDLDRLTVLDEVFNDVVERQLPVARALQRLDEVDRLPPRYPTWVHRLSGLGAAAAAAHFFGGGFTEVLLGAVLGLLATVLGQWLGRSERTRVLTDFLTGLLAGLAAAVASHWVSDVQRQPLILAGIILALPGVTLTIGLSELAHRHLVSGTARLLQAMIVLFSLLFGVAVAIAMEQWAVGPAVAPLLPVAAAAPLWMVAIVTLGAAIAFSVNLAVPPRYVPAAVVSGFIAWSVSIVSARYFAPGALAAFVGALATGLYTNLMARVTDRPAQVFLVPGIVMLVPGAFGFLSFEQLLRGDPAMGTAHMFQTLLTAAALVTGTLLANASFPPRKIL